LKLCGTVGVRTELRLRSYIRVDNVEEVPLEVLYRETRPDGLSVTLLESSFVVLVNLSENAMRL